MEEYDDEDVFEEEEMNAVDEFQRDEPGVDYQHPEEDNEGEIENNEGTIDENEGAMIVKDEEVPGLTTPIIELGNEIIEDTENDNRPAIDNANRRGIQDDNEQTTEEMAPPRNRNIRQDCDDPCKHAQRWRWRPVDSGFGFLVLSM